MVKPSMGGEVAATTAKASHFAVGHGKNNTAHARHHASAAAHGAWFLGHIEGTIVKPPIADNGCGQAYGIKFTMAEHATTPDHIVAGYGQGVISPDNDRSDGNLTRIKGIHGGVVGQFHPVLVARWDFHGISLKHLGNGPKAGRGDWTRTSDLLRLK